MKKRNLLCLLMFLFITSSLSAQTEIPRYKGFVNDFAGMLTGKEMKTLETKLASFEDTTSVEVAVLTIEKLKDDQPISDYSMQVAEKWKVGKAGKDNGVIIVISKKDREIFILTGYGIEPVLTDGECGSIIRNIMRPKFKEEEYYEGINTALDAIVLATKGEFSDDQAREMSGKIPGGLFLLLLVLAVICALAGAAHVVVGGIVGAIGLPIMIVLFYPLAVPWIILLVVIGFLAGMAAYPVLEIASEGSNSNGGGIFGGSSSGGGFSFGGGGFGGGGAGGGW